jgi:hypothetical protein
MAGANTSANIATTAAGTFSGLVILAEKTDRRAAVLSDIGRKVTAEWGNWVDDNLITLNRMCQGEQAIAALVTGQLSAGGLTYPTVDGQPGEALVTDGDGGLSFAPVSVKTVAQCFAWQKNTLSSANEFWIRIKGDGTTGVNTGTDYAAFVIAPLPGRLVSLVVNRTTTTGGDTGDTWRMYVNNVEVSSVHQIVLNGATDEILLPPVPFLAGDRIGFSVQPTAGSQRDYRGSVALLFEAEG